MGSGRQKATERCIVFGNGAGVEIQTLYAFSADDTHLYDDVPDSGPPLPPHPPEDGEYLLIDNVWVRQ